MQNLKKKTVGTSIDEEHKPTEIFIMLPLDIIAVGELQEGEIPNPSQPCASLWQQVGEAQAVWDGPALIAAPMHL